MGGEKNNVKSFPSLNGNHTFSAKNNYPLEKISSQYKSNKTLKNFSPNTVNLKVPFPEQKTVYDYYWDKK